MKKIKKMKKIIIISLFLFSLSLLTGCKKNIKVEKSFPEIISEIDTYILEAKLETYFPSGTRECEVLVYYNGTNMIRVELTNPNVNEKQILIKNKDGVFVLIPSINKTFKVNSNWPNASSQSYLLHSLCHDIVSEENIISNNDGNKTTLELKTKPFGETVTSKQQIIFDNKTKMPKEVVIYNNSNEIISRLIFNKIETNIDINKELFVVEDTLSSARIFYLDNPPEFDRVITYPTYCPEDTKIQEEIITGSNETKKVIMKYSGTNNFTIIESYVGENSEVKTEYYNGDIYVLGGSFALTSEVSFKFYDNGIEYVIASTTAPKELLVFVAESLRTSEYK